MEFRRVIRDVLIHHRVGEPRRICRGWRGGRRFPRGYISERDGGTSSPSMTSVMQGAPAT